MNVVAEINEMPVTLMMLLRLPGQCIRCCFMTVNYCHLFKYGVFNSLPGMATDHCWCQKTRVIALSCGIKISAVHCLVLSQSTRDRRTVGQTELRQLIQH